METTFLRVNKLKLTQLYLTLPLVHFPQKHPQRGSMIEELGNNCFHAHMTDFNPNQ